MAEYIVCADLNIPATAGPTVIDALARCFGAVSHAQSGHQVAVIDHVEAADEVAAQREVMESVLAVSPAGTLIVDVTVEPLSVEDELFG